MTFQELIHKVHEEFRYKHDLNLMDRDVIVSIDDGSEDWKDVEIKDFSIDHKGQICILVDAPEEESTC